MRLSVYLFFLLLYLATTAGHIYTIDSYLNYAVTAAICDHGRLSLPRTMMTVEGREGRNYSKLGIGQSLANIPLYLLGKAVERLSPGAPVFRAYSSRFYIAHGGRLVTAEPQSLIGISDRDGAAVLFTTLTNALVAAAVCLLFFMLLQSFGLSAYASLLGTVLLGFATPLWVYSRDLFGEPTFAASLLGSFYFVAGPGKQPSPRRAAAAGGLSALGILTRMSFAPIVALFAFYFVFAGKDRVKGISLALLYSLFALGGLIVVGILNWVRFESILASGYHTAFDRGFSFPFIRGIGHNLFSPYRSVFLYAPAALLFFAGVGFFARVHRVRLLLIASIVIYMFAIYSRWWAWHGGWCWGPRFYVPIVPILMLPGLVYIGRAGRQWLVWAALVLGIVGAAVQAGAVCINYTAVYDYWIKIGRLDWAEVDIHLFSPITTHWKAMLSTPPSHYDLYMIQGAPRAGPGFIVAIAALGVALFFVILRLRRELDRARA